MFVSLLQSDFVYVYLELFTYIKFFSSHLHVFQDNVQCALEVSRLQLEEWKSHGPQAHEEALTEKALLQEELVTVRARMCDVSLVCKKQKTKTLILDYNNISSLMLNHPLWVIELNL